MENLLLRNSQFAVTLYHLIRSYKYAAAADASKLVTHYQEIYASGSKGREMMEKALKRLDLASKEQGFEIILTMVPDIHSLEPYPFGFIHEHMKGVADKYGWKYLDFTEALGRVPSKELWAGPGDPHINQKGHKIMAETLLSYLK